MKVKGSKMRGDVRCGDDALINACGERKVRRVRLCKVTSIDNYVMGVTNCSSPIKLRAFHPYFYPFLLSILDRGG